MRRGTDLCRSFVVLCAIGTLTALGAAPASAAPATAHMTGNLSVAIQGTTNYGPCPAALSSGTEQFSGTAKVDDTEQNYQASDNSLLNMSGSWMTNYCTGTASGQASGSNSGFTLDPQIAGTQVDWSRDVTHPGQYGLNLDFHVPGTVTQTGDTGGCADGYPTAAADWTLGMNFPEPSGGFGTVHIDKTLTPLSSGGDTEGDVWTGGPYPCANVNISDVVVHVTGDLTIGQVSSGGNGNNPAGSASGGGSTRAGSNGSVTVGKSSCAGPNPCSDGTTVTGSGSGTHSTKKVVYGHSKVTVAAGKTVKLKVKLTKAALKALKKAGKLKTTVTVVVSSQGAKTVTKTFKLTIKAPK